MSVDIALAILLGCVSIFIDVAKDFIAVHQISAATILASYSGLDFMS